MRRQQDMVRQFHEALGVPVGDRPAVRDAELRARLLLEEAGETVAALESGDLVGVIDGLCDVIYIALGTAVSCGVELEPFFREVHRSNMRKLGAGVRADGKVLKPEDWTPPDIKGLLLELYRGEWNE
jgi:predicted HAD superfamily Cof-like phosphohydrolase